MTSKTLRLWIKQADLDEGKRNDGLTSDEQEELRRLRRGKPDLAGRTRDFAKSCRPTSSRFIRPAGERTEPCGCRQNRCRRGCPVGMTGSRVSCAGPGWWGVTGDGRFTPRGEIRRQIQPPIWSSGCSEHPAQIISGLPTSRMCPPKRRGFSTWR